MIAFSPEHIASVNRKRRVIVNFDALAPILELRDAHLEALVEGMFGFHEIRGSLRRLSHVERVVIMHCVAVYPLDDREANLRALATLKTEFPGHDIGYFDHTCGLEACVAAVALGATVLEKHFTFNTLMPGTDHLGAMTPQDLGVLAGRIARLEPMLGTGEKGPSEIEKKVMHLMRDRFGD